MRDYNKPQPRSQAPPKRGKQREMLPISATVSPAFLICR